jgi:hypothetical protein
MDGGQWFSPEYNTARTRFCQGARQLGCRLQSHHIGAKGPKDEPLTIDVAAIGDTHPQRLVIVSSGLHGAEGFFGSAIQLAWLEAALRNGSGSPPLGSALLMIHALNPYGFAWVRRWNENNVDLNRSFLTDYGFLTDPEDSYQESRAVYARLNGFLNPPTPPSRWEPYRLKALRVIVRVGFAARRCMAPKQRPLMINLPGIVGVGLGELQKSLPVGQYEFPRGIFYGGLEKEETTRFLAEKLPEWTQNATQILHLDFHSGLGKHAEYKLLIADALGTDRERWVSRQFGEAIVEPCNGRDPEAAAKKTAYSARGAMATYFRDCLADKQYHCLTAEFGTYSRIRVLGALRAENRAHFYDRRGSNSYRWTKRVLLEAFCPAARSWRNEVIAKGLALIKQVTEVCFGRRC